MAALPSLELICFGAPTASVGGAAPVREVLWRKHLGLLVYLALSPNHRRSREHLIGIFWAESPQEKARRSLNESLYLLKKGLGEERLLNEGTSVVLNNRGLQVDALRLAPLLERAPHEAVDLLRGAFLEGFHVDEAPEFEEWMSAERRRFDTLAASAFVAAGERDLNDGRLTRAADFGRRALDREPHSEPAIRLRMRALALSGDSSAALAAYHEFIECLERDVHEKPSKALIALAERIRSGTWRFKGPNAPSDPPLVGRAALHNEVRVSVTDGLAGGPRTVVITGAPGMGRTRLLAECTGRGALEGARLVAVRPLESDHDARWSTLRHLLRAGLSDAPGLTGARPEALAALAGIAPELAGRFSPREPRDVADVAAALTSVLAAVADEAPLALAIDDAHWADGPTLAALHAAIGGLAGARVVFLVSAALGVGEPLVELQQLQAAVRRALPGTVVRLDPLTLEDLGLLVSQLATWCHEEADRERLTRRLAYETGGSPLFAITLLGALERANTLRRDLMKSPWPPKNRTLLEPLPFSVPSLVRMAVQLRVGELSKEEEAILRAASLGGLALDLDLIAHIAERPASEVERVLPTLERRQLVVFDGARYLFTAPIVAEVVRTECLTRGERRRLEQRAVAGLAGREDLESRVLRGELLARIAPDAQALAFVVAALRDAQAGGGTRLARRAEVAADRIATSGKLDRTELDAARTSL